MNRHSRHLLPVLLIGGFVLAGCTQSNPPRPGDANNPSPTAGSGSAQKANEMADKAMYKPIQYKNATVRGPNLVVIPGDIKSSNASFTQKFGPNNIADFAELELSQANFGVLERSDLGPLLQEFQLAYTLSDPDAARKLLQRGKLKTTKWVVKLDILKAEPVATAQQGFDGRAVGQLLSIVGRNDRRSDAAGTFVGSIKTEEGTGVWLIGMRYKVLDAVTTEQVATGYAEQKMEVGSKSTSVMGFSQGAQGGLTLDGMVQRLVQQLVFEIDAKHKGAGSPPPAARSVPATVSPGAESARATPESVVEESTPMAAASVPATTATTTPGPATAEPAQPAQPVTAEPPPTAPLQSRQSPSDAPSTPPSTAPLELASVAPPPVAAGEAGQGRQAAVPVATSQDRIIKIGTMTASGRFTTDPVTGTLSGTGIVTWADGNRYEGPMVAGKKQGPGTFVWPNGQRYEGDWLDDQMTGTGILRFADGDRYEGRFKNGEPHGTGVYTLKNGDQYNGEWVAGSKHGKGRLTWASGDYWEGEFRDDRQTDNGKLVVIKPIAVDAKQ
jgi:hypothetical protein